MKATIVIDMDSRAFQDAPHPNLDEFFGTLCSELNSGARCEQC